MNDRKLTRKQVIEIQDLLDYGVPIREISEQYDISKSAVCFLARRETYREIRPEWRYKPRRPRGFSEREKQRFLELYRAGYTQAAIKRLMGTRGTTLFMYMEERGEI